MKLKILFEDNHLIVCVKNPGILSQASNLNLPDMLTIIKDYIKVKYDKKGNVFLGLVHRLDLNVGGVMVFAKTSKAASRLSKQLRENDFNKSYLAVVHGKLLVDQKEHVLENYLKKDNKNRKAIITNNKKDKYSKLIYKVLGNKEINNKTFSLVDVLLETGRFHQIRAQFSNIGHPIYGDNKYGRKTWGYELGLYAYKLVINHPITKEELVFINYPSEGVFKNFNNVLPLNSDKLL